MENSELRPEKHVLLKRKHSLEQFLSVFFQITVICLYASMVMETGGMEFEGGRGGGTTFVG